ncbi:MAG: hypothetical protein ACTSPA_06335 [Promethearchaeota archaeon]
MKNKTLIFYLQTVLFFLLLSNFTTLATSHGPHELNLTYDLENSSLTATFKHSVSNRSSHYVETVIIKLNGTTLETLNYTSQPTTNEFSYVCNISASEGDEIFVSGTCSLGGTIYRTLIVVNSTDPNGGNGTEEETSILGFSLSIVLISSMGIFFIIFPSIKKKLKVIR